MADIKIDSKAFQERLSHFIAAWKADKRAGDALFAGASSIVILMGKVDEEPEFYKNNAMHVRLAKVMMIQPSRSANWPLVLAPRLRVPDHPDALYTRHPIHPHNTKERFAYSKRTPVGTDNTNLSISQRSTSTRSRAAVSLSKSSSEARTPPKTRSFSSRLQMRSRRQA